MEEQTEVKTSVSVQSTRQMGAWVRIRMNGGGRGMGGVGDREGRCRGVGQKEGASEEGAKAGYLQQNVGGDEWKKIERDRKTNQIESHG